MCVCKCVCVRGVCLSSAAMAFTLTSFVSSSVRSFPRSPQWSSNIWTSAWTVCMDLLTVILTLVSISLFLTQQSNLTSLILCGTLLGSVATVSFRSRFLSPHPGLPHPFPHSISDKHLKTAHLYVSVLFCFPTGRVRTRRQSSGSVGGASSSVVDSRGRSRAKVVSQSQRMYKKKKTHMSQIQPNWDTVMSLSTHVRLFLSCFSMISAPALRSYKIFCSLWTCLLFFTCYIFLNNSQICRICAALPTCMHSVCLCGR